MSIELNHVQLEHRVGDVIFQGKELTTTRDGKVVMLNNLDYSEFLGTCMQELIKEINKLSETITSLQKDIRRMRVGQEAFVYGDNVDESDEIDSDELNKEDEE